VRPVEQVGDLSGYTEVVLGSAVYVGRWLEPARRFVEEHADELAARPTWLFSSGRSAIRPSRRPAKQSR
jgi:menaquinone-dependent protoporphyrinogen oxidase